MKEQTTISKNKIKPAGNHWAVFIDNNSDKNALLDSLLESKIVLAPFRFLSGLTGTLFSKLTLLKLIDEESRHGTSGITKANSQSLQTMSSGEQKKILLTFLLESKPDYLILDSPFDNLDKGSQKLLKDHLEAISTQTFLIQVISRKSDLLPLVTNYAYLEEQGLHVEQNLNIIQSKKIFSGFEGQIPKPLNTNDNSKRSSLIELKNVNVTYGDRPILKEVSWKIKPGEFWELSGENGSGKTTILSMITGENPKGYGQDLFLFGYKKGNGESVWDIKKNIGYFTPAMTEKFTGFHSVEHMIISGILDSIGLYVRPTEAQLRLAKEWLLLINMWTMKDVLFHDLSMGQKRLIMTTRAMIKHPPLLILDEPTAGLDDQSASLLVSLVNKMAKESNTSIIFVSHRTEPGLKPQYKFVLSKNDEGSKGKIV